MSSVVEDLITYLVAAGVSEVSGTTLFEGPPPELPLDLVALTNYAGEPALDRIMGPSLTAPGVEIALVQLYVRNIVLATAKATADAYHALLDGLDGTYGGRKFFNVESLESQPHSIGQDKNLRWMLTCNFRVVHAR